MGTRVKKRIKNYAGRNFKKQRIPDKQTPQSRSVQMSKIRSKNTKFEEEFINLLNVAFPNKFVTHVRILKGIPDIVFEKQRVCVFLDSDFWHGWQYPRWKHLLKNDFWREKIIKNRQRDVRNTRLLKKAGWRVVRLWEHQVNTNPDRCIKKIRESLHNLIL